MFGVWLVGHMACGNGLGLVVICLVLVLVLVEVWVCCVSLSRAAKQRDEREMQRTKYF
jgi:hypothetical protein